MDKTLLDFSRCIVICRIKDQRRPLLPNTQHSLDKLESLLSDLGYKVRYEKGNFKTGACMLQTNKIVVVNRFSNLEMKISALVGLLRAMPAENSTLSDKQRQFLRSIKQTKLTI